MKPIVIKKWELNLVSKITSRYTNLPDKDELQAELYKKLLELKHKKIKVKDWKSFLAKALFNASNDYLRKHNHHIKSHISLDDKDENGRSIEIISPACNIDGIELKMIIEKLSPELRALWDILMLEGGNITKVAKRLNKPRTTVNYYLDKLKDKFKNIYK